MMKSLGFLISLLVLSYCFPLLAQQNSLIKSSDLDGIFKGKIKDKYEIEMFLKVNDKDLSVEGVYFYTSKLQPIQLKGKMGTNLSLILNESTDLQPTGIFEGYFKDGVYSGSWSSPDGKKKLPFAMKYIKNDQKRKSWTGKWTRIGSNQWDISEIEILGVSDKFFPFDIVAQSGSHTGAMKGVATISGNSAGYKDKEAEKCELTFIFSNDKMGLKATPECSYWAGVGVYFDGEYSQKEGIKEIKSLDVFESEQVDTEFKKVVGEKNYQLFLDRYQFVQEEQNLDKFESKASSWAVRGMYMIMEAIVMWTPKNKFYAAVIDEEVVRYFSNDPEYLDKIPKTIENWRERFSEKNVVYMSLKK
jgi:hypothetical protein